MFTHEALVARSDLVTIYTALSKHTFYYRKHISRFVLEHGKVPLNPFMLFDYFLLDTVDRDLVRSANNTIVRVADELWVFGVVSNGVLAEITLARTLGKPVRYFALEKPHAIVPIDATLVRMEEDVEEFREKL